jgi:hypothetical protein
LRNTTATRKKLFYVYCILSRLHVQNHSCSGMRSADVKLHLFFVQQGINCYLAYTWFIIHNADIVFPNSCYFLENNIFLQNISPSSPFTSIGIFLMEIVLFPKKIYIVYSHYRLPLFCFSNGQQCGNRAHTRSIFLCLEYNVFCVCSCMFIRTVTHILELFFQSYLGPLARIYVGVLLGHCLNNILFNCRRIELRIMLRHHALQIKRWELAIWSETTIRLRE